MDDNKKEKDMQVKVQDEEIKEEDLIENYQQYLKAKEQVDYEMDEEKYEQKEMNTNFTYDLERFDYVESKQKMKELFGLWMNNAVLHQQSLELLNQFKQ